VPGDNGPNVHENGLFWFKQLSQQNTVNTYCVQQQVNNILETCFFRRKALSVIPRDTIGSGSGEKAQTLSLPRERIPSNKATE
jgi:hypothetical protein